MHVPQEALAFLAQCVDVRGILFSAVRIFSRGAQREHLFDGGRLGQNYELRVSCVLSQRGWGASEEAKERLMVRWPFPVNHIKEDDLDDSGG